MFNTENVSYPFSSQLLKYENISPLCIINFKKLWLIHSARCQEAKYTCSGRKKDSILWQHSLYTTASTIDLE
ncbi:hypothetical protein DV515_00000354 [Chloebia gouldiae]|uniref:Uncharacterized protein n=1 Tax=Chloebia gouldiae TaxID=44316 RepID=A0A3L8T0J7_CHLGU|nr:hypothetical protein DV515_00000354 [Chloebia gouldiae]